MVGLFTNTICPGRTPVTVKICSTVVFAATEAGVRVAARQSGVETVVYWQTSVAGWTEEPVLLPKVTSRELAAAMRLEKTARPAWEVSLLIGRAKSVASGPGVERVTARARTVLRVMVAPGATERELVRMLPTCPTRGSAAWLGPEA